MILGLDLGQNLGWVLGNRVGPLRHGVFTLKNTTDLGAWLRSSDEFFQYIFQEGVTGVAVEQPFMGSSYQAARKLLALLGHAYYWASFYGIPTSCFQEVAISTGKRTLSGYGKADKDQMIAAAAARGYPDLDTEHEADALGVWWVYQFGAMEPAKRKPKSSKGRSIINDQA